MVIPTEMNWTSRRSSETETTICQYNSIIAHFISTDFEAHGSLALQIAHFLPFHFEIFIQ